MLRHLAAPYTVLRYPNNSCRDLSERRLPLTSSHSKRENFSTNQTVLKATSNISTAQNYSCLNVRTQSTPNSDATQPNFTQRPKFAPLLFSMRILK
ncbi:jg15206 [Pararge aegeria aegeria]|uniref:Jg15206 protein n=1 Tax=Pararge aegeria aegeria TaxID=348720 RepID=A0A8S4QKR7_9NEOP|nr:jg15206 [Pararge aegeria aegeria]